jgi:hypothetical protein
VDFAPPVSVMLITVWISSSTIGGVGDTALYVTLPAGRIASMYSGVLGEASQTGINQFSTFCRVGTGGNRIAVSGLNSGISGNPWVLDVAGTTVTFQIIVFF